MKKLLRKLLWYASGYNFRWGVRYHLKRDEHMHGTISFAHEISARKHYETWKVSGDIKLVELLDAGTVVEWRDLTL